MHSINKRKVDVWEDEWEKEATVSSKREQPRNRTAVYTSLLEDQHLTLSETCTDLEASLAFLTTKLASLEMSLAEKQAKADDRRQQAGQMLDRSVERAKSSYLERQKGCSVTLHENQQDLDRLVEQDRALAKTLDQLLLLTESAASDSDAFHTPYTDKDTLQMEELLATHNELEHRYMHAKSHGDGYKARAQVLEKELQKMNGLPQIIPILKSTTETYDKEIQHYQRSQANLALSESIETLARQRIRAPLTVVHQMKETHQVRQTTLRLKKVYQSLVRQRACQQLLLYAYQIETKRLLFYKHALLAYQQDLQKKPEKIPEQQPYHSQQHQENDIMPGIKRLLATYDDSVDYEGMTHDQVIKAIEKKVALEQAWNKKWTDDVNDNLDAIQLLDQSKHDLARTLFGDSASRETLELKAKSYDDAQWTLTSAINEVETELDALEKEYHAKEALFQERRAFVSLFFTDPFLFQSKMEDHLDSLAS